MHVISRECLNGGNEERVDNVREAVYLLGKTNKIREMLEKRAFFSGTNVEDWCDA